MIGKTILCGAKIATQTNQQTPYGLIDDGVLVMSGEQIEWVGSKADLPEGYLSIVSENLGGCLVTPGLIDCHTHVVFGGDRAREFEMRLNGVGYEEIARDGGGINSTVLATRKASLEQLIDGALPRVDAMIAEGLTTIEIKSGYGLERETELNMLRAAREIGNRRPVTVRTTYLGAHATPPEYKNRDEAYIEDVVIPTLQAGHEENLVDGVDGFCEGIAFQPEQIARVFDAAKALGLPVKLHAEQLSNLGGAKLAASYGALSADHIEYLDEDGVVAMAAGGTTGVILPGAFYTLRETQPPPVDLLRKYKVPMALASDCNPGSSPLTSLLLTMNMGCTLFRMTPEETLAGVTRNAARALGLKDRGVIAAGQRADLAIWDVEHPAELSYRIGFNPLNKRIFGGQA